MRRRKNRTQLSSRNHAKLRYSSLRVETLEERNLLATVGNNIAVGNELLNYRIAIAATAEYTSYFGGQANTLTAIQAMVADLNDVYEKELSIHLELVSGTNLIYTNAGSDPYSNGDVEAMVDQNQANMDAVLGRSYFDLGHVFGTKSSGYSGLAYTGVVGFYGYHASGASISKTPTGSSWVSHVGHEIGHQFGAAHTYNSAGNNFCSANRDSWQAYEPGSGSSIMSYAGSCDGDDLQSGEDFYFHSTSFEVIHEYLNFWAAPDSVTPLTNSIPTIDAGWDYTIPANTPFELDAIGLDDDADDTLTYSWEQLDLGPAQSLPITDNGSSPLFRSFEPTIDSTRIFPRLDDLLNKVNTAAIGEALPSTDRSLNFRATIRDGEGGVNSDDVLLTVVDTGVAFAITSPNTGISRSGGSLQTINWNVAGTDSNGIDAEYVDILMSSDGGHTFPYFVDSTPNDGSHSIVLPNITTSQARFKIKGSGNVFFDISDANFSITRDASVPEFTVTETDGIITVNESGTTGSFSVAISRAPLTNVVFILESRVWGPREITLDKSILTFTPTNWNIAQTVIVSAEQNTLVDGIQGSTITIRVDDANSDDAFDLLADQIIGVISTDDDFSGFTISETGGSTSVDEDGAMDAFDVVLDDQPLTPVVLTLSSSDTDEVNIDKSTLTFTNANWNIAQTVLVTAVDDPIVDGSRDSTITISIDEANSDDAFATLANQTVSVTSADNDIAGYSLSQISGTTFVDESGTNVKYNIVLDRQPLTNVVFMVTSSDTGEVSVDKNTLTFTSTNWNVAQTVTLTGVNDFTLDGSQDSTVTIHVDDANTENAFNALADQIVSLTTMDDDVAGYSVTLSAGATLVDESGTQDSFKVVLDRQPLTPVVFTLETSDASEATLDKSTLTFTFANWDIPQTVTVTGEPDTLLDGSQDSTATISIDADNSNDAFDGLANQTVDIATADYGDIHPPALFEIALVAAPTQTSSDGSVAVLPVSRAQVHEWEEYYLEFYVQLPALAHSPIANAQFTLDFDETSILFDLTNWELGGGVESLTVDTFPGEAILSATIKPGLSELGVASPFLIARVPAPINVIANVLGRYPNDSSTALPVMKSAQVSLGLLVDPVASSTAADLPTSIKAVRYDLNDDNRVGLADLSMLVNSFGLKTSNNAIAFRADFDKNGSVGLSDLSRMVNHFGNQQGDGNTISFPALLEGEAIHALRAYQVASDEFFTNESTQWFAEQNTLSTQSLRRLTSGSQEKTIQASDSPFGELDTLWAVDQESFTIDQRLLELSAVADNVSSDQATKQEMEDQVDNLFAEWSL